MYRCHVVPPCEWECERQWETMYNGAASTDVKAFVSLLFLLVMAERKVHYDRLSVWHTFEELTAREIFPLPTLCSCVCMLCDNYIRRYTEACLEIRTFTFPIVYRRNIMSSMVWSISFKRVMRITLAIHRYLWPQWLRNGRNGLLMVLGMCCFPEGGGSGHRPCLYKPPVVSTERHECPMSISKERKGCCLSPYRLPRPHIQRLFKFTLKVKHCKNRY